MKTVRITHSALRAGSFLSGRSNGHISRQAELLIKEKNISLKLLTYIFVDLEDHPNKKITELLSIKTSFLKNKKGIFVVKNREGNITHIRLIYRSLFGAIDSFVKRTGQKMGKFYLAFIVLEEESNNQIRKIHEHLREEFLRIPVNGFESAMILSSFRKGEIDLQRLDMFKFLPISQDPNVREYFPYSSFGSKAGIYFIRLTGDKKVLYIGWSKENLAQRCASHFRPKNSGSGYKHVYFNRLEKSYEVLMVDLNLMKEKYYRGHPQIFAIEQWLIGSLKPEKNLEYQGIGAPNEENKPDRVKIKRESKEEEFLEDPPF